MNTSRKEQAINGAVRGFTSFAGISLIAFGILILVDQYLKSGWISSSIPFLAGVFLLIHGIRSRLVGYLIAGGVLLGSGAGAFVALSPLIGINFHEKIGAFFFLSALGWLVIYWFSPRFVHHFFAWALVPAGFLGILGVGLWFAPVKPVDYILLIPTTLGLILLLCGVKARKFGLIIPGCILVSTGPGVFFAWGQAGEPNGLAQTGIMLVTFALGWGLITLFSRVITNQFVWWPLIPGGVLAMVGWGLYIGGDPHNALSFIGNTGSVGLIIFGIYLLMWRNNFRR